MRRDLPGPTAFFCPPRRLSINAAVGAGAPDGPAAGSPCYAQGRTLYLPVGRGESTPPLGVYRISCNLSLASQSLTPSPRASAFPTKKDADSCRRPPIHQPVLRQLHSLACLLCSWFWFLL